MSTSELVTALAAEHAALYGYGVVGAHVTGAARESVKEAEEAHRSRRDALARLIAARGQEATPAEAAYTLPFPVTNTSGAVKLATHIEERAAAVWRAAVSATAGDDRKIALAALIDCATRASSWRRRAGLPGTVPFPGDH